MRRIVRLKTYNDAFLIVKASKSLLCAFLHINALSNCRSMLTRLAHVGFRRV
jgi:hypothetical protein